MVKKGSKNLYEAINKVEKNKKTAAEKKEETMACSKRLAELELYLDLSEEKRALLLDCILNTIDDTTGKKILEKGIVLYARRIEVVPTIVGDLEKNNMEVRSITGKTTSKQRIKVEDWFCGDPKNKVIIISDAGGQSINLHATNELVLYNIPNGFGKYKQVVGRIARGFGIYDTYNVHIVSIEDSLDIYKQVLISSKKELEFELLKSDTIPVKGVDSFNGNVMKAIKKKLLWKK